MKLKHTAGPWKIEDQGRSPFRLVTEADPHAPALALLYLTDPKTRKRTEEYAANAKLIAAAPDLAEELFWVPRAAYIEGPAGTKAYIISDERMESIKAALKKAGIS